MKENKMEKAKFKVKIAVIAMKNSLLKKFEAASASSLLYPKGREKECNYENYRYKSN